MANIDHERKRLSAAILFFGPPGAGKTTSLYALARQLPPGTHGKVGPLQQGDRRLLKLDYRPHDQEMVHGYQVSFRLVACPGSIEVDLLKPLVGAVDALLFVADSSRQAMAGNVKALDLLDKMVRGAGKTVESIPMVYLYNKRDLREAVEIRTLEERLNRYGCSYIAASAVRGQGVIDGLQRLTASVALQVRQLVQAQGGGTGGGSARTVAHGSNFKQAQAMQGGDDSTAVSSGSNWGGGDDDDRTEVNPHGDNPWDAAVGQPRAADLTRPNSFRQSAEPASEWDLEPPARPERRASRPAAPAPANPATGSWRTPDAFAEDVDADDRTMPGMSPEMFDDEVDPDDVTSVNIGGNKGSGGIRTNLTPVGGGRSQPARNIAQQRPPPRQAPPRQPPPRQAPARPAPQRSAPARKAESSRTRRVVPAMGGQQQAAPPPQPQRIQGPAQVGPMSAPMPPPAPAAGPGMGGGGNDFTATQVINSLQRPAEAWENQLNPSAQQMRIPVPELAGYVISRIGTPKASTRRTVEVPVRATHMDTLMPQDIVLHIQFSSGMRSGPPQAPDEASGKSVPMSWFVGAIGLFVIILAVTVAGLLAGG